MRPRLFILLSAVLVATAFFAFRATRQQSLTVEGHSCCPPEKSRTRSSLEAEAAPHASTLKPGKAQAKDSTEAKIKSSGEMAAFTEWTQDYLEAAPEDRAKMVEDGVKLAQARRPVIKQLIKDDPKTALGRAVPMVVRQQLPTSIVSLLEQRLNGVAAIQVFKGVPAPGEPLPNKPVMFREAEFKEGGTYRAYVYGSLEQKLSNSPGVSLNGIAVDSDLAVNDSPSRQLEPGEKLPAEKPLVAICPISGLKTEAEGLQPGDAVSETANIVETATEIVSLCGGYHRDPFNQTIIWGEGVSGGVFGYSGNLPSAPTPSLGTFKVLAIPMTYADTNKVPATEAELSAVMRDCGEFFSKASFGKLTMLGVVTPPVKLQHNEAWYVNRDTSNGGDISGTSLEHQHAREAARQLGYDWNDYDCIVVRHNGGPGSYGGLASGNLVWARDNTLRVWCHEMGHTFGLSHANFWDTAGTSSIGVGTNEEYGHDYDMMSGASTTLAHHYNSQAKNQVRWLPSNFIQNVTQSGLYRIYAMDTGLLLPSRAYSMTITKDTQRVYWADVRTLFDTNPWIKNGLFLGWRFPNGGASNLQLIDSTPGSPFLKEDSPISLGSTFSDTETGIHITTVAMNDSPRYMDVAVNFGFFPTNNEPTLTLAASNTSVPTGATVTFTATAADADGDTLAYSWQNFGDTSVKVVPPNAPTMSRTFPTAGSYVVTCTVSDMKGGTASRNVLITVGNGNSRYAISGRITNAGAGVAGVTVLANGANGVVTDTDGYYIIPNLSANSYSMTPLLYGFNFSERFNNNIVVGPSATGADFVASPSSFVTITAPNPNANELAPVTTGSFRLTRTGDLGSALVVNVNSASGGATKGTDYTFAPDYATGSQGFSTFTIPANSATLDVVVTPLVDALVEGPETVILQLGPGVGYLASNPSTATVVINDDDTVLPKVSLAVSKGSTIENSGVPMSFTFTRTGSAGADLIVPYSIGGTATNGTDYTSLSGSITIPNGAASATLSVSPIDDALTEPVETVALSIATGAGFIADPLALSASANLVDDDVQTVSVVATDPAAQEIDLTQPGAVANTGTFVITRTGDTTNPLTVYYAMSGTPSTGTPALHGVDYEQLPGLVTIPASQTQATVTIIPRYDTIGEGPETAVITLGAGSANYVVGTPNVATVTINDAAGTVPYIDVENIGAVTEPSTTGTFRFTVRGDLTTPLIVNYSLSGTATNGVDYDSGSVWNPQTSNTSSLLNAVWAADANNAWAVGAGGTIMKWDGTSWSAQSSGVTSSLNAVWGTSTTSVWAAGDGGVILKWNGTAWSAQTSSTTNILRAVWGTSATSIWVVGDGGTILFFNGTAWSAQTSGIASALYGVWGSSATSVWSVGAGGVIRFWNGTTWAAQTSPTTNTLRSITGSSATSLWAAGAAGTLLRSTTGTSWSTLTSPTTQDLAGIWAADASNAWASGSNGVILRTTNATTWTVQVSNAVPALSGVRGISTANVWAVGANGTIVNYNTAASIPLSGSFTVPLGMSVFDMIVRPIDDAVAEELENVAITITPSASYTTFGPTSSTSMWVIDNEQPSVFVDTQVGTAGSSTVTEGTTSTPTKFYVSRTGSTTAALAVNFTLGGSATAGTDYTVTTGANLTFSGNTGTLTIAAGALGGDIPLVITNDTTFEGTETITFDLAAGSYGRGPGTLMYLADNETSTASVGFQASSSAVNENAGTVNIPVTLSSAQAAPVSIDYALGTNTSGSSSTVSTQALPYWVRVVRAGSSLTFFESNDGSAWVQRGSAVTLSGLSSTTYYAGIALGSASSSVSSTASVDNFAITGLDAGATVGSEGAANLNSATGSHTNTSGVYSITATGTGPAGGATTDQFRFVYFPVSNSANCTVTARLASQTATSTGARLGVMLRNDVANAGAIYAASLVHGTGGFLSGSRATLSAASATQTAVTTPILSKWFRIQRSGDIFTSSQSNDGITWLSVGSTQTIALGPTTLAGIFCSARSDGAVATATFDNVSLTGSGTLQGRDAGFVNVDGSESLNGGVWTVNGSGSGVSTGGDEGRFVAREVSGDFTLIARLTSLSGGASNAQAGVMMRTDRNGYARDFYVGWSNSLAIEQFYRTQSVSSAFGSGVDYTFASGTLTFAPGETSKNISIIINDDNMREPNNLVTFQLLNPNGAVLGTNSYHGLTIVDNDTGSASPYVSFAAASTTVAENAGFAVIQVSLSTAATTNVSIDYSMADGTALSGSDYTGASGTLNFAAGDTVKTITVPILDDGIVESAESFTLTLSNPAGLLTSSVTTHTVTINDDDLPTVSIVTNDPNASETGPDNGQFTISRSGPTTSPLTVLLARSGTATNSTDFTAIATPLSFVIPTGQASATLDVVPVDDASNEGSETVIETISADAAYVIGTASSATVTIADNDRSTVTIAATDNIASETSGNTGTFTITRTAPTNVALTVTVAIAGTATNTTDYSTVSTSVAFAINDVSKTITITPVNDSLQEGDETVAVNIASGAGNYTIGTPDAAFVTIQDNDSPPTLFINSPGEQGVLLASSNGIIVSATVSDDGLPSATTLQWTQVNGPGTAAFASPTSATTAVTFSVAGTYALQLSAFDGLFTSTDQVTVVVGGSLTAGDWISQDLDPIAAKRGQGLQSGTQFSVNGSGAGYASRSTDQASVMLRSSDGDGSIVARLTTFTTTAALSGITIRDSMARGARRAVLGYVPGTGLQFRARTTASSSDTLVATGTGLTLPLWLKLDRVAATNNITASYSSDGVNYTQLGTTTAITMDNRALFGLTTTSNNTGTVANAVLDNVSTTPALSGQALVNEDATASPSAAGSSSESLGTYTIAGSTTGYFYGWQYYGDLVVTARLNTMTSGAGSAIAGLRLSEGLDAGAYVQFGRIGSSAYNGYYWTVIANGTGDGLPSGVNNGDWLRVVRKGTAVTAFRAPNVSGSPGTWIQVGQPQTIIMTTPVWVGFYVNNASGVGLNTATFSGLTIESLNKAPIVGIASTATYPLSPVPLDGTVTDDSYPTPVSLSTTWSRQIGPASVLFADATQVDTTATLSQPGSYVLRLTANDSSAQSFKDLTFTGYAKAFEVWQAQNWTAYSDPNAVDTYDADRDGQANLLEYAFGTAPQAPGTSPLVYDTATVSTDKYLRITVPKNASATDVTFTVEATSDLTNPSSWSSAGLVTEQNTSTSLIVRDAQPMSSSGPRFMRVKVVRN